jgi:hypothetical protein
MTGVELIAAERKRQVEVEGWTPEHDDEHEAGEIALAASCYALDFQDRRMILFGQECDITDYLWPWESRWWKPTPEDRIRELVKAGALVAAEIDRLQRQSQPR